MADNRTQPENAPLLRQSARAGWLLVSRTGAFLAIGIIINWGLCALLALHARSGAGAATPPLIANLSAAAVLLFLLPFLYFLVGKTRGIKAALASLARDNRAVIHTCLEPVLRSALRSLKPLSETATRGVRSGRMSALLSNGVDQSGNLPRPMRWLLKSILKRSRIAGLVGELKALRGSEEDALSRIRVRIDEELAAALEPGWGAPAALFIVNAVFAAGIYRLVAG